MPSRSSQYAIDTHVFSASSSSSALVAQAQEGWSRALRRLRIELGDDVYNSWFGRLEIDDIQSWVMYLSVPTKFLKNWITSHYLDRLVAILRIEIPEMKSVVLNVRSAHRPVGMRPNLSGISNSASSLSLPGAMVATTRPPLAANGTPETDAYDSSPLDPRFTFDTFLVGNPNRLAHAAAERVASHTPGESLLYNPLYIHAAVGLGKTHLLQACAQGAKATGHRVLYLTAERFMYGFVSALKNQSLIAFKERLRTIDVLIIDDIQFLQGKSIQTEFCHTINALIDANHQIVIAADRPPAELESLDERIKSRLSGGLCLEMQMLDEELRAEILQTRITAVRATHPDFQVPGDVVSYIARTIQTNGRDLDGAINRILAHSILSGAPLTLEKVEEAIRDLVRIHEPKRVKIDDIQKLVAARYNITREEIISARRTAGVVRPRQIAMYLSKKLTSRSLPEIGRRFGGRDHTTVLHAVRKIEEMLSADTILADEIKLLDRMLCE